MQAPTLAQKLGTTTHLSPILQKARRLGLDGSGLERLAIQRGCDYYAYEGLDLVREATISRQQLSDEELAIALLNPALPYNPQSLRIGAAMLGAEGNDS